VKDFFSLQYMAVVVLIIKVFLKSIQGMSAGFLLSTCLLIHSKNFRRPTSQGFAAQNPCWLSPEIVYMLVAV